MKKFWLISALCTVFFTQLCAECSITTETDDNDRDIYIMENDYIKAVIAPASSGRISEFVWKNGDRHYFPELEYNALELTDGVFVVSKSNYAGYEDWIYEDGLIKQYVIYKAKILKNTPEICSISVSCEKGQGSLERIMTIRKGSSVLEIDTILTGFPQNTQDNYASFWGHIMIDVDRCADHDQTKVFIPTKKPALRTAVKKHRGRGKPSHTLMQQVPFDCVVDRMAKLDNSMSDMSYAAQPWRAYIANDLLLGTVVPLEDISPDGHFYNYIGLENPAMLSIETIFAARQLLPGKAVHNRQSLIGREWKHAVDYLDNNLLVAAEWNGTGEVTLTVGGFAGFNGVSCSVELLDNGKTVEEKSVKFGNLSPLTESAAKVSFAQKVTDPRIKLTFKDASGKVISSSELLKRIKFPLK